MRVWTNTTFRALDLLAGPEPAGELFPAGPEVGVILERLAATGAMCTLTRIATGQRRGTMEAKVERVTANAVVIGRPHYRPGQKGLIAGERLELHIALADVTYRGETHVIAKYAPDGDKARNASYRLAKPTLLMVDDRRANERIGVASNEPARAELLCAPRHKPLGAGPVVDLSSGGLRVRASDANVRPGDRVMVRARLSEEIRLHALGIVVHAGLRDDGTTDVGLHFQSAQPDIERFIRALSVAQKDTARRTK